MSFRLIETSIRKKSIRETKLSIRIVRLESEHCPELADVLVIFAHGDKERCIAVMRVGRVWFETYARFKMRRGLIVASDPLQQICVHQMKIALVRLKAERCFHMRDRSVEFRLRS